TVFSVMITLITAMVLLAVVYPASASLVLVCAAIVGIALVAYLARGGVSGTRDCVVCPGIPILLPDMEGYGQSTWNLDRVDRLAKQSWATPIECAIRSSPTGTQLQLPADVPPSCKAERRVAGHRSIVVEYELTLTHRWQDDGKEHLSRKV